ncbi:unnamed protein product, partial [Symbiodinium microadriaticum]
MAASTMTQTAQVTKSSSSKSGGADHAIAVYAEEELKKYVKKHCLSKETEKELRTLTPEELLGIITEASKGGQKSAESVPNVDGSEDVVVMARITRLKVEKGILPEKAPEPAPAKKKAEK